MLIAARSFQDFACWMLVHSGGAMGAAGSVLNLSCSAPAPARNPRCAGSRRRADHEIIRCGRRPLIVEKRHPIGRQPAKRHDVEKTGTGDCRERSVVRCHVVPKRGRGDVLCLEIGRFKCERAGPIVGSHRGDLRFDEYTHCGVRPRESSRRGKVRRRLRIAWLPRLRASQTRSRHYPGEA